MLHAGIGHSLDLGRIGKPHHEAQTGTFREPNLDNAKPAYLQFASKYCGRCRDNCVTQPPQHHLVVGHELSGFQYA